MILIFIMRLISLVTPSLHCKHSHCFHQRGINFEIKNCQRGRTETAAQHDEADGWSQIRPNEKGSALNEISAEWGQRAAVGAAGSMQKGCRSDLTDEQTWNLELWFSPVGGVRLTATWSDDPGGDPGELLRQCVKPTSPTRRRLPRHWPASSATDLPGVSWILTSHFIAHRGNLGPLNCDQRKDVNVPFALVLIRTSNENRLQANGFWEKRLALWSKACTNIKSMLFYL